MASSSLAIRLATSPPTPTEPFRFLDLPGEIRNKIYGIFLTVATKARPLCRNFWSVPGPGTDSEPDTASPEEFATDSEEEEEEEDSSDQEINPSYEYKFGLETQILRTCRSIKAEAGYVLRQNLFVKLTFRVGVVEELWFCHTGVPFIQLDLKHQKQFKLFVLSHQINAPDRLLEKPRIYIFLHRDLDQFCTALSQHQPGIVQHRSLLSHVVTLRYPFAGSTPPGLESFFNTGLQENLVAPYRARLRDLPHFTVKGTIPQDLKLAIENEVLRPFPRDPAGVIHEVRKLTAEGIHFFHNGRGLLTSRDGTAAASEYWNQALKMIDRAMLDASCRDMRTEGGIQFLNRLVALSFNLNSNKAGDYLKCMRYHADNQTLLEEFGLKHSEAVLDAMCIMNKYCESTWRPTPEQMAKLAYRTAVRCRLGGEPEPLMLTYAEAAIQQGLILMPDDDNIKKEEKRIARWRRQLQN